MAKAKEEVSRTSKGPLAASSTLEQPRRMTRSSARSEMKQSKLDFFLHGSKQQEDIKERGTQNATCTPVISRIRFELEPKNKTTGDRPSKRPRHGTQLPEEAQINKRFDFELLNDTPTQMNRSFRLKKTPSIVQSQEPSKSKETSQEPLSSPLLPVDKENLGKDLLFSGRPQSNPDKRIPSSFDPHAFEPLTNKHTQESLTDSSEEVANCLKPKVLAAETQAAFAGSERDTLYCDGTQTMADHVVLAPETCAPLQPIDSETLCYGTQTQTKSPIQESIIPSSIAWERTKILNIIDDHESETGSPPRRPALSRRSTEIIPSSQIWEVETPLEENYKVPRPRYPLSPCKNVQNEDSQLIIDSSQAYEKPTVLESPKKKESMHTAELKRKPSRQSFPQVELAWEGQKQGNFGHSKDKRRQSRMNEYFEMNEQPESPIPHVLLQHLEETRFKSLFNKGQGNKQDENESIQDEEEAILEDEQILLESPTRSKYQESQTPTVIDPGEKDSQNHEEEEYETYMTTVSCPPLPPSSLPITDWDW